MSHDNNIPLPLAAAGAAQAPPVAPGYEPQSKEWYSWLMQNRLGYKVPRPWQTRLPIEIDKARDVFLISATGGGKSALIHVPILVGITEGRRTLGQVIVPTKTSADDQVCFWTSQLNTNASTTT